MFYSPACSRSENFIDSDTTRSYESVIIVKYTGLVGFIRINWQITTLCTCGSESFLEIIPRFLIKLTSQARGNVDNQKYRCYQLRPDKKINWQMVVNALVEKTYVKKKKIVAQNYLGARLAEVKNIGLPIKQKQTKSFNL